MRSSTLDDCFLSFVEEPTRDSYLSAREQIIQHPKYDPHSDELRRLELVFESGNYSLVCQDALALLPVWNLSPKFHYLVGISALESGDIATAEREKQLSQACLFGLTTTGEGTQAHPFLVTYLSDEYDLLRWLEVEPRQQQIVELGDRRLDLLRDRQGTEHWFDVTDVINAITTTDRPQDDLVQTIHPTVRQA